MEVKCFNPTLYKVCKKDDFISVKAHINNTLLEKDGRKIYNTDVVAYDIKVVKTTEE